MQAGERQVAPTVEGIRADHRFRYEFAARVIPRGSVVLDFACGVGYGSRILFDAGHQVTGCDIDQEALDYAEAHYAGPRYEQRNGNAPGELPLADAAVCFETIEHLEDPQPLLKSLRSAPLLIASVPNEAVFPWRHVDGAVAAYHFRHYLKNEFQALLTQCGWKVKEWHGQMGPEADVEPEASGRTLIALAERAEIPEEVKGKHIAICALGPSVEQYVDHVKRLGGRHKFADETWVVNAMGDVLACDLIFHMDDVRIQEIRAKAAPASNIAAMLEWMKKSPVPIVTSRSHPSYPALVEYPLEDVLNHLGHDYFNSTAPYVVAFAIHHLAPMVEAGAECKISVWGFDFTYANTHQAEKGRACVEFWLGQAAARGIKIALPKKTTLMDAQHSRAERLYGYDTVDISFDMQPDGSVKLSFKPKEKLPTAEEIERAYDHSAPIAEQHLTKGSP